MQKWRYKSAQEMTIDDPRRDVGDTVKQQSVIATQLTIAISIINIVQYIGTHAYIHMYSYVQYRCNKVALKPLLNFSDLRIYIHTFKHVYVLTFPCKLKEFCGYHMCTYVHDMHILTNNYFSLFADLRTTNTFAISNNFVRLIVSLAFQFRGRHYVTPIIGLSEQIDEHTLCRQVDKQIDKQNNEC